jgi:1-acyl-sn-glycerol-3-phosphate acyltransferase
VEGLEHVPREGRAVFAANHAGWFAFDAFFLGLAVGEAAGPWRTPFFATADAALAAPVLGPALARLGSVPASWFRRPERLPPDVELCGFFPEGVEGNCKPFWQAYRMRPWKRGFIKAAATLDAPIIPTAIIGGEECLPVAWTVRALEPLVGSILGLPLSWIPLPTRWRVVFHRPVRVPAVANRHAADGDASIRIASSIRRTVQETLDRETKDRPLARLSSLVASLSGEGAAAKAGDPLAELQWERPVPRRAEPARRILRTAAPALVRAAAAALR